MPRFILPAIVGFILTVANVRADEPKAVNLEELKQAVATAAKRGENVAAVVDALNAFEKAMAKFAGKENEAPPELAVLRDAVEMAAKKGERVDAISKELGRVEKSLTGHEYERPKPLVPQPEPEPRRDPIRPGGRVVIGGGPRIAGMATSITISNGSFTIKSVQNKVTYSITGDINGNEITKIVIQDGDKKIEAEELKKVPEEYRDTTERLLKMIRR